MLNKDKLKQKIADNKKTNAIPGKKKAGKEKSKKKEKQEKPAKKEEPTTKEVEKKDGAKQPEAPDFKALLKKLTSRFKKLYKGRGEETKEQMASGLKALAYTRDVFAACGLNLYDVDVKKAK